MSFEIIGQNASNVVSNVYVDTSNQLSVKDSDANTALSSIDTKITTCDTGAVVISSSALPTGAATESTLATLSGNVTACNTGAVVVSSSALPTGAATSALQTTANGHLSDLAGCVSGTTLTVSSGALSTTNTALESATSVADGATETTSAVDCGAAHTIQVFGSLTDSTGNIKIQLSANNSDFFDDSENSIFVDSSGFFAKNLNMIGARYVRLSYSNSSGSSATWTANLSIKS